MDALNEYERSWGVHENDSFTFPNIEGFHAVAMDNLCFNQGMSPEGIHEKFSQYISGLVSVYNELQKNKFIDIDDNTPESITVKARINRVMELVYYAKNVAISFKRIQEVSDLSRDFRDNTDASLFRFKAIDMLENTPYQNLLLYVLNYMYDKGYKRYNGDVYGPILTGGGHNTHSWKYVDSISDVVYGCAQKEVNFDQFLNFSHRSDSMRAAVEFLTNCKDSQFDSIQKDRHVFSFENGIYDASTNNFTPYTKVDSNVTTSKYFNVEFDTHDAKHYTEIDTPYFDSIVDYQDISDEAKYWVYVFIGRLLYDVNEKDGWQVIFFFQGQAGTGKSTIANVCKSIYSDEDVGIMSNNIQRKFGLADIVDKKMFIAPEIKRDFCLEQAEFQSMVSGESMSIAEKYKKSKFVLWKTPGVLAGNETPDFIDNYGSIQRRIVSVRFTKKVMDGDMLLGKKLNQEIGRIIHKCNMAYIDAYTKYSKDDVWKHLPQYFVDNRNAMAAATNPLIHLLASGKLRLDKECVMPEREFIHHFNGHCADNNYSKPRFNPDFYTGPFTQFGITIKKNHEFYWPPRGQPGSRKLSGTAFIGVDVAHGFDLPDDEEDIT